MPDIPALPDFLTILTAFDNHLRTYVNTPENNRRIQDLGEAILQAASVPSDDEALKLKIISVLNDIQTARPQFFVWTSVSRFFRTGSSTLANIESVERALVAYERDYVLQKLRTQGSFADLPMIYRKDPEFMLEAIRLNPHAFLIADESLKSQISWVKRAAESNGLCLEHIPEALQSQEVVNQALAQNPLALKFAPVNIKKDMNILKNLVVRCPEAIKHVANDIKSDTAKLNELVKCNPLSIRFLDTSTSEELMKFSEEGLGYLKYVEDRRLISKLLHKSGFFLQYLKDDFKKDKEFIKIAYAKDARAINHANPEVLQKEFLMELALINLEILQIRRDLIDDQDFMFGLVTQRPAAIRSYPLNSPTFRPSVRTYNQRGLFLESFLEKYNLLNNPSIVMEAVKNHYRILEKADPRLKSDLDFVMAACMVNNQCIACIDNLEIAKEVISRIGYSLLKDAQERVACDFLQRDGLLLQHMQCEHDIPLACRLCAVTQNGLAIQFIMQHNQTPDLTLAAVCQNGLALQFIPYDRQTVETVKEAVIQNIEAFQYVNPKLLLNRGFIEPVCRRHPELIDRLDLSGSQSFAFFSDLALHFPEILRNKTSEIQVIKDDFIFASAICKAHPECFQHLSDKIKKDKKFILDLIALNPNVFTYVDASIKTDEFILEAIEKNADVIKLAPASYRTELEKVKEAVKRNGLALKFVKEELKNEQLAVLAVKSNGLALEFVPGSLKQNLPLIKAALRRNGEALKFVPPTIINKELALLAVSSNGLALETIRDAKPEFLLDPEILLKAVSSNGLALKFVPPTMINKELALLAVSSNGLALETIRDAKPEFLLDSEILLKAVSSNGLALEFVPEDQRNVTLCQAAVQNNGHALRYVPVTERSSDLKKLALRQDGDTLLELDEFDQDLKEHRLLANMQKSSLPESLKDTILDYKQEKLKDFYIEKLLTNRDRIPSARSFSTNDISPTLCKSVLLSWGSERNLDLHNEDKRSLKDGAHRQKMMKFLFDLDTVKDKNGEPLTNHEKIDLFFKCYKRAPSKNLENIEKLANSLILSLKYLAKSEIRGAEELDQATLDNKACDTLVAGDLINGGDREKFITTISASRSVEGIYTYAQSVLSGKYEESVKVAFKVFLQSVIDGTLPDDRHKSNSYKSLLTPDQKAAWEAGQEKAQDYKGKAHVLIDSEDWQDLFMLGTEVSGSCQRVDGDPRINKCLLGYGLNGKCRVLCLKETKDGPIKARAVIKIIKKGETPVILLEPTYARDTADLDPILKEFAKERARALGLELYTMDPAGGGDTELVSDQDNLIAPFEYEDGNQDPLAGQVVRGITTGKARVLANKVPL